MVKASVIATVTKATCFREIYPGEILHLRTISILSTPLTVYQPDYIGDHCSAYSKLNHNLRVITIKSVRCRDSTK